MQMLAGRKPALKQVDYTQGRLFIEVLSKQFKIIICDDLVAFLNRPLIILKEVSSKIHRGLLGKANDFEQV